MRLVAVLPWFAFLFALVAGGVLLVGARRVQSDHTAKYDKAGSNAGDAEKLDNHESQSQA